MRRDSLVLTSSPSRHRTRTTKEAFEDRHVPCTLTRDSHFPRMGVLPAHRSRDRGRMTIHGVQCIRRTRHAHVHAPAWAPRSERARSAPCLGAPLCSPRSARVARALQTQPGQQWQRIRQEACAQPGPGTRREAGPHLAPRSARRSDARFGSPRSALRASLGRLKRSRAVGERKPAAPQAACQAAAPARSNAAWPWSFGLRVIELSSLMAPVGFPGLLRSTNVVVGFTSCAGFIQ